MRSDYCGLSLTKLMLLLLVTITLTGCAIFSQVKSSKKESLNGLNIALKSIVSQLDHYGEIILENQVITREQRIAYLAWKNNTSVEEIQKTYKGHPYDVPASDVMHGNYRNNTDIRVQEGTYTIAFLYQCPASRYYKNEHVLNSVLWSIDYMTRAQGSNGGFNEAGRGWPGAPERKSTYNPVAGFTLYAISRSIIILYDQPSFQKSLAELIDADGLGYPHITRRSAWLKMLKQAALWIVYDQRGHGPNQDVGNVVSAYTVNEAYALLHPDHELAVEVAELDNLAHRCLEDSKWWTYQSMVKERNGQQPAGYDGHYGAITQYWLGLLVKYNPNAADRLRQFLDVFQYYYYPASMANQEGTFLIESVTANRIKNQKEADIVALAVSYQYHPAMNAIYQVELESFIRNPKLKFPGGSHIYTESLYKWVDFVLYAGQPHPGEYTIPALSAEPWLYLDPAGRTIAAKTEDGALVYISLTWKSQQDQAPYHVVGKKAGTIAPRADRRLDLAVIRSGQPYAYEHEFPKLEELINEAHELIDAVIHDAG